MIQIDTFSNIFVDKVPKKEARYLKSINVLMHKNFI